MSKLVQNPLTATAAASSGTWGFSAGMQLDMKGSKTTSSDKNTQAVASNIVANNTLNITTHDLDVHASTDTTASKSDSKDLTASVGVTMYGGGASSASIGYGDQHNTSESETHHNSTLNANTMNILASNDANFKGATVRADNTLNLTVGNNLTVESVRDTSSSASHGMNASMGVSVGGNNSSLSGANASVGMNNSRSSEKQTVLTSLTGNTVNITTGEKEVNGEARETALGHTHIKGALIAAGDKDANGVFRDNNNLNLSTKTLTFENLANTKSSNSTGLGIGAGVNSQGDVSSVSAQIATLTSYERTKTLATLGNGNINITDTANSDDMERLNRDTTNITKSLVKTSTGTSVSGTLDTRLLTEAGRVKIKDDVKTASTIVDSIVQIATTERAGAFDFFKETEKNVNVLNGMKNAIASDEKLAQQLSNPNLSPEQKQSMLGEVAQTVMVSLGYTANTTKIMYNDTTGEEGVAVKGHYSPETNTNYINDQYNDSTKELITTTGHETQHAMDQQSNIQVTNKADNEQYSTNFGNTVADYTDYALGYNNKEAMAQTNSHEGAMTLTSPTQTVNVITNPLLTQNNNEFAGVDKTQGSDDVLVPVNKRLSSAKDGDRYPVGVDKNGKDRKKAYTDLGFDPNTPYVKYDLLSLNFNNPKELETALKDSGFASIDDFRQAYANNPNDPKIKTFVNEKSPVGNSKNIAPNYTYESRQIEKGVIGGNGTILGDQSEYVRVNNLQLLQDNLDNKDKNGKTLVQYITTKQHKLGISDDAPSSIKSKIVIDGDQDKRNGVDIHSGSCYASTGCVTSTTIPFSVPNHQKVADELIKIAPSLGTNTEPTYIYLPTKADTQGDKK